MQSASGIGGMPEKRPLIKIFSVFFCVLRYRMQASWSLSMNCWFSMPNCVLIPFSFSYSCRRFRFLDTGNTKKTFPHFVVSIGHGCFFTISLLLLSVGRNTRVCVCAYICGCRARFVTSVLIAPHMSIRSAHLFYSHVNSWQTKTFMTTGAILKSTSIPACVERLNWVVIYRLKINH